MKKILLIIASIVFTLTACAKQDRLINYLELPATAQEFIERHFNVTDISMIERERDGIHFEYTVYLNEATEIDFGHQGNLKKIDCQIYPIPVGIVPDLITKYVTEHYPNHFIVEYEINNRSMKVELGNSVELIFDLEGNFLRVD